MKKFEKYKNEYLLALNNELSLDEACYLIHGVKASEYLFAPRPQIWLHKYKKYQFVKFFIPIIKIFMLFGGWSVFLIEVIKYWNLFVDRSLKDRMDAVAIAFSEISYDIIISNRHLLNVSTLTWVNFPWNSNDEISSGNDVNIYSLLSKLEVLGIFIYSIKIFYSESLKYKGRYILQYYTVMRWLLVRHALSKIDANLYISTEHFDRWAILLDCCIKNKSAGGREFRSVIFQHGILKTLDQDGKKYVGEFQFHLPSKLEMVTEIFAYDADSVSVFKEHIISHNVSTIIKYHVIPPRKFTVQNDSALQSQERIVILFVGHPMCIEQQKKIYNELSKGVFVYYKPHPTTKITSDILNVGWRVINEKDYFPEVDFLISYPSTLVREYHSIGIDAIVHPLNADSIELSECISSVLKRIGNDEK
ncbi:hypothetical protein [Aeromonas veronii]|uniref:hypothetical protein n=1 Tax=Aeromonas veronii TaxID=654 RepID=UPI0015D05500|nr:hypothetical protein [Aeromonas veronii]QLH66158.1 hypothetical protein HXV88_06685 [Aeromonas veronii]